MSETRDKRRRTDLDLFVLALIDSEVLTPYELQKAARLSQGATIPALQRLLEARLVRQGKPGTRGRTEYKVTAAGRELLKAGWLPLVDAAPTGDIDADLRVALLALWGGDRRLAVDFLYRSAEKQMESIATFELTGGQGEIAPLARLYTDLRSGTMRALLTAGAKATRAMAEALPKRLTGKPRRSKHPTTSGKVT